MSRKQQPTPRKHKPRRTCIVCRQALDKRALTRVVKDPDLGLIVDPSGKRQGRGAYVCQQDSCWEAALARPDLLARALKVTLNEADLMHLRKSRAQYA